MSIKLRKQEKSEQIRTATEKRGLQNLAKNYSIEYLTTAIELVLPTFKSWTVHKIIEYLTLGLLFSL